MKANIKYFWCIVTLTAFFILGYVFRGCDDRHRAETVTVTHTDTLTVRDTIVERHPVFVTIDRVDTMLIAIRDTVTVHDTSYVVVDREQKHYRGDDYEAWVSGYRPALDSIYVFPQTKYITTETIYAESRKRWGLGIQAGIGGTIQGGRIMAVPYLGVGVSYSIIRW